MSDTQKSAALVGGVDFFKAAILSGAGDNPSSEKMTPKN